MSTETCTHGAGAVDTDSDDLNVLELPEASGSDVTGSDDDDSDSSEGNWVMHEPSSAGKAPTESLANGQKQKKSRLKGADEHEDMPVAKKAKQKGKAAAADRKQDTSAAEGSHGKRKGAKRSDRLDENSSEPAVLPDLQEQPKKSKKAKKASAEDVFAPVEEFEDMLQDDAPLQPVTRKGKAGKRSPKAQKLDKKVSEHAEPDEEYEWG